jgi:hypothetical protein
MINGSMITIPFVFYLIFSSTSLFHLEVINQSMTSLIGIIGLLLIIKSFQEDKDTLKRVFINFICFLMLLVPLAERLSSVPIELFNYLGFKIPLILFLLFFMIYIFISILDYKKQIQHSKSLRP